MYVKQGLDVLAIPMRTSEKGMDGADSLGQICMPSIDNQNWSKNPNVQQEWRLPLIDIVVRWPFKQALPKLDLQ